VIRVAQDPRLVGGVAALLVGAVLVSNLVRCSAAREASARDQRLGERASRSLSIMASRSPDRDVRDLAFLHFLAERIPETRLWFPAALKLKPRVLAGFARVEGIPVEHDLTLAPDAARALAARATGEVSLGSGRVRLIEAAGETRYVLVGGDRRWLLVPEPIYRAAGGAPLPQEPAR
jgi:hypothetical protein